MAGWDAPRKPEESDVTALFSLRRDSQRITLHIVENRIAEYASPRQQDVDQGGSSFLFRPASASFLR